MDFERSAKWFQAHPTAFALYAGLVVWIPGVAILAFASQGSPAIAFFTVSCILLVPFARWKFVKESKSQAAEDAGTVHRDDT